MVRALGPGMRDILTFRGVSELTIRSSKFTAWSWPMIESRLCVTHRGAPVSLACRQALATAVRCELLRHELCAQPTFPAIIFDTK